MHKSASKETVTSLHDLSAVDLIAGFQARRFSPSEVLEDVLAHIAVWEPHIKALYAFDPDGARATAKASTERWQKGEPMGPLDGVPVTIKDNIAVKGVPVPLGAASVKLVPAAADAPPVARLREAGAVIFSKTTMPDYGMLSSGLSSFHPLTRNPWDLAKNPGGSSAGAGAAGAARRRLSQARAFAGRRAAGGAPARGGRGDFLQNHHAGLRHAVVGAVEFSPPHPQSLGSQQESWRLQRRGRRWSLQDSC